jgi:hypothetical protein
MTTELQFIYTVALAFMNDVRRVELTVWNYRNKEDADARYARLMEINERMGDRSPILSITNQMSGIYDEFSQSLFTEGEYPSDKVN